MEEWQIRQNVFHRLNPEHTDDLKHFTITISEDIVGDAVRYFTTRDIGWVYPSKSYMVGICYARWLSETFGGDPLSYLNVTNPDILFDNDPYYVPYSVDTHTYDAIIEAIGGWAFDQTVGLVPDVRQYFEEEFMIND